MTVKTEFGPVLISGLSHSGKTPLRLALDVSGEVAFARQPLPGSERWGLQQKGLERGFATLVGRHPALRMVILVRDPRTRASFLPASTGSVGRQLARWEQSVAASLDIAENSRLAEVVRYEDLLTDTTATLRSICSFVGLEFVGEMVAEAERRLAVKAHGEGSVDEATVRFIEHHSAGLLDRLNYPVTAVRRPFNPVDTMALLAGRARHNHSSAGA